MVKERSNWPPESGEDIEAALLQPWYRFHLPAQLERRFDLDTSPTRSLQVSFALLTLATVHLFMLTLDSQAGHAQLLRGCVLRLPVEIPLLIAGGWIFRSPLPRWMQGPLVIIPVLVSVLCDTWLGLHYSGPMAERYFMGLGLTFLLNNLVIPMRLRHAAALTLISIAVYDLAALGAFGPCPIVSSHDLAVDACVFAFVSVALRWRNEFIFRHSWLVSALDRLHTQQLAWANRRLTELSYTDSLTGLPNRRYFDEVLAKAWHSARDRDEPLALMMIDVDHFKNFNDSHGHAAGDKCLQRIAHALQFHVRVEVDTVARYGGEEFVAILPGALLQEALPISERVKLAIAALQMPHSSGPQGKFVTVSVGLASCEDPQAISAAELLRAADEALYSAKSRGRDCVVGKQIRSSAPGPEPAHTLSLVTRSAR